MEFDPWQITDIGDYEQLFKFGIEPMDRFKGVLLLQPSRALQSKSHNPS